MLSQKIVGADDKGTYNSVKRECIQVSSVDALARLRYSDSVDDLETTFCLEEI